MDSLDLKFSFKKTPTFDTNDDSKRHIYVIGGTSKRDPVFLFCGGFFWTLQKSEILGSNICVNGFWSIDLRS